MINLSTARNTQYKQNRGKQWNSNLHPENQIAKANPEANSSVYRTLNPRKKNLKSPLIKAHTTQNQHR